MVYNPDLWPKMKKPNEEDIQDAKLLYYMPKSKHIEAKRNHVGLAEGLIVNIANFNPAGVVDKTKDPKPEIDQLETEKKTESYEDGRDYEIQNQVNFISIEMDNEVHIAKCYEKNLWIYMIFIVNYDNMEQTIKEDLEFFPREKQAILIDEFYNSWHLFYGDISSYLNPETDRLTNKFETLFEEFLVSFFHGDWGKKLPENIVNNELRYEKRSNENSETDEILKYSAPLSRFSINGLPKISLTRQQFLLATHFDGIIKDCDQNFKNYFVLYKGHLIYTTINYKTTLQLQKYFYDMSQDTCQPDNENFIEKFKDPLMLKGGLREGSQDIYYGYLNRGAGSKGVLHGATDEDDFTPIVNLQDQETGEYHKYRLVSLYFKRFLVVILRQGEGRLNKSNFNELRVNLKKLQKNASPGFDTQFTEYVKFHERFKKINVLYYNCFNYSFTRSPLNKFTVAKFDYNYYLLFSKLFNKFTITEGGELILKISKQWLYLYRWNGRIMFCISVDNMYKNEFLENINKIRSDIKDVFL